VAAVSVYLDASVLVSLFVRDANSDKADRALRAVRQMLIVSDFAAAEFASGISQHVRTRSIPASDARVAFSEFDEWTGRETERMEISNADVDNAATLLRRLDLPLRTPDALHVVMVQRNGSRLLTFDKTMAAAARALGIAVIKV
jgi:predicted nucleic acid-binding protein